MLRRFQKVKNYICPWSPALFIGILNGDVVNFYVVSSPKKWELKLKKNILVSKNQDLVVSG
jgi:hypothetical protein